ncbi:hypothetical protein BTUL_0011g00560 [Botrytis tulipae]|uniref:Defective in cullin neddylation protein n=1 Tax=Botrytis tulipae TaxID=87230 RepID=A0A4Z1F3I1_9HELO|nr:hypothetical protein BTUL_0011g00560 [Botrytis tulipae]
MPLNLLQRSMLNEFMQITGASERNAMRILKSTGWKLEAACDRTRAAETNIDKCGLRFDTRDTIPSIFGMSSYYDGILKKWSGYAAQVKTVLVHGV